WQNGDELNGPQTKEEQETSAEKCQAFPFLKINFFLTSQLGTRPLPNDTFYLCKEKRLYSLKYFCYAIKVDK
ncbi:hypothetical protein ACI3PL_24280, partial [Lacticaseibacillus paracasei]